MTTFLATLVLIVICAIFCGVGAAIRRWTSSRWSPWPVSIGVGFAATIAAGGILNLAHIAYPSALWTLTAIEAGVALLECRRTKWKLDHSGAEIREIVSAAAAIGLVTIFAIATQLPQTVFNSHDDFEKYFAYPVRMLETGTLVGSPLSALGSEALGGQTFLHGFVFAALPMNYINAVDGVFGFAALMLLTAGAGWRRFSWFPGAMLGPLLIAAINPQYVNVSSLYTGALLMGTAVMLADVDDPTTPLPAPLAFGLVYGSMIALKPSFVIFAVFHLAFLVLIRGMGERAWDTGIRWTGKVAIWASLFTAPWILLHLPNYLGHGTIATRDIPLGNDDRLNLLSTTKLFYGGTYFAYTTIVLVTMAISIAGFVAIRFRWEDRKSLGFSAVISGAAGGVCCYLVGVAAFGKAFGYMQSLRLSIPFILGACVTAIVSSPARRGEDRPGVPFYFPLGASLAICAMFAPTVAARYRQAAQFGTTLAFPELADRAEYIAYNQLWLSTRGKQYVAELQDKVPPGEPLLVWINTPFLLDYKRNTIIDGDTVGFSSPWARVPGNVHYVLWQYQGLQVRREGDYLKAMHGPGYRERLVAATSLGFARRLSQAAQSGEVVSSDEHFVLFRLRTPL